VQTIDREMRTASNYAFLNLECCRPVCSLSWCLLLTEPRTELEMCISYAEKRIAEHWWSGHCTRPSPSWCSDLQVGIFLSSSNTSADCIIVCSSVGHLSTWVHTENNISVTLQISLLGHKDYFGLMCCVSLSRDSVWFHGLVVSCVLCPKLLWCSIMA